MPWNECKPMDERLRFIARLLEGEKMAPLCREFGISRVTGYKIFNRYKDSGLDGLNDRSRAPDRLAAIYLAGMREAARAVEGAADLETASAASERITEQCQGCHAAAGIMSNGVEQEGD